ncbi:MAG: YabP/YqfC family sporulation protein [Bacilli bacterium]
MKIFDRLDNYVNDKMFSMIYKNNKLDIINYSKIIDFTSTIISVSYNNKIYQIKGDNLVISRMMDNEILISGNIDNITFI